MQKIADGEIQKQARKKLIRRYMQFVKPYRFTIFIIVALGMLQFAVPLAGPWMTKIMIDEVLLGVEGSWTIDKIVIVLGLIYLSGIIINYVRNYITADLGNRMAIDLRRKLYEHIQTMSQKFFDTRQIGSIVSRILHDVNGAQNLIGGGVINLVVDLFLIFFAAFMLFTLDLELALLSLWLLPLYYLTFTNLNVRIRFAWRSVHRQMERISGVLVERISGMKVVQSFNREQAELGRFNKQAEYHRKYAMKAHVLSNLLGSISQTFNHIGTLLIWFVGGYAVLHQQISVGGLVAFQAYLSQLYGPIQRFSQVNVTIQNSMSNIERIFEVFDYEPDVQNAPSVKSLPKCRGEIAFEHVTFTYVSERPKRPQETQAGIDPDIAETIKPFKKFYWLPPKTKLDPPPTVEEKNLALIDISLHAKAGEVIALVGPSGAGKSTLVQFIPRFYDPDEGRVTLDGRDLRDYDVADLREHIAMVMQDNILFSGTVFENIAYGNPGATLEQVVAAAKAANAHDFITRWEYGYDTLIGERGLRLSGGQKQRIAIARALLKNPQILILDEATSALDAESEALVTEALERLMEGRTTFIIAHRLATVVRADLILVMDQGRIVERGSHQQLLQQGGLYRELYEKQLKAMRPEKLLI
ncbi:ABC transporter ATP-binding protein [Marinicrinis lubricantis]|uniref:ABC transporter ATP-binding protein n=1 Tax=Marinicrinis lubricantis TaxID=2086470 RepID=UPI0039EF3380